MKEIKRKRTVGVAACAAAGACGCVWLSVLACAVFFVNFDFSGFWFFVF